MFLKFLSIANKITKAKTVKDIAVVAAEEALDFVTKGASSKIMQAKNPASKISNKIENLKSTADKIVTGKATAQEVVSEFSDIKSTLNSVKRLTKYNSKKQSGLSQWDKNAIDIASAKANAVSKIAQLEEQGYKVSEQDKQKILEFGANRKRFSKKDVKAIRNLANTNSLKSRAEINLESFYNKKEGVFLKDISSLNQRTRRDLAKEIAKNAKFMSKHLYREYTADFNTAMWEAGMYYKNLANDDNSWEKWGKQYAKIRKEIDKSVTDPRFTISSFKGHGKQLASELSEKDLQKLFYNYISNEKDSDSMMDFFENLYASPYCNQDTYDAYKAGERKKKIQQVQARMDKIKMDEWLRRPLSDEESQLALDVVYNQREEEWRQMNDGGTTFEEAESAYEYVQSPEYQAFLSTVQFDSDAYVEMAEDISQRDEFNEEMSNALFMASSTMAQHNMLVKAYMNTYGYYRGNNVDTDSQRFISKLIKTVGINGMDNLDAFLTDDVIEMLKEK